MKEERESPQEMAARVVSTVVDQAPSPLRRALAFIYALVGFECIVTGWAYLPWTKGPTEVPAAVALLTPLWPWGAAWAAAGLLCIIAAVSGMPRVLLGVSIGSTAFMHLAWASFYAYTYFDGADHRAYITSSIYLRAVLLLVFAGMLMATLRPKVAGSRG